MFSKSVFRLLFFLFFSTFFFNNIFSQNRDKWKLECSYSSDFIIHEKRIEGILPGGETEEIGNWDIATSTLGVSIEYLFKRKISIGLSSGVQLKNYRKKFIYGDEYENRTVLIKDPRAKRKLNYFRSSIFAKYYFGEKKIKYSLISSFNLSSFLHNEDSIFIFKQTLPSISLGIGIEYELFKTSAVGLRLSYDHFTDDAMNPENNIYYYDNINFSSLNIGLFIQKNL